MREAELRRAVGILGIDSLDLLGYRDKQLAAAPVDEIREKLVRLIRLRRPRVVITFDPPDTERRLSLEAFRCAPGYDREGAPAQDLWSSIG